MRLLKKQQIKPLENISFHILKFIDLNKRSDIISAVKLTATGLHAHKYEVLTDVYEGPLDLLLELIEKAELDITTLALAQVTNQYLQHMTHLQQLNPAEVSAFLVIAARLVQIKSSALLPKPPVVMVGELEEDPGEALIRQLIEYRKFKKSANFLDDRQDKNLRTYLRVAPPMIKVEPKLDLSDLTLDKFTKIAKTVFFRNGQLKPLDTVVKMARITIGEKIQSIVKTLKNKERTSFKKMLTTTNRIEIVITFLALLELVKRNMVQATQDVIFADIEMVPIAEMNEDFLDELELGEL